MNITLTGTKVSLDTHTLALAKNNLVNEIICTVDTDESWTYRIDVLYSQTDCSGNPLYNIINLNRTGNVCSAPLTIAMLPFSGKYTMQLRGIKDQQIYHSDIFEVWVKYSVDPSNVYDPVPSEFYQIEDNIIEINNHPPYPDISGFWMIWNPTTHQYELSTIPVPTEAGGGEVNQNAWSNISVKKQSTATTAVAGATADTTIQASTKTDTFAVASGNKWVDIGSDDKQINIGHSLSGVTAGTTGAANSVPAITVDAAGHITKVEAKTITPATIGAATTAQAEAAQNAAEAAQASADAKVASVGATANGGIAIGGTATEPTVGIKLDPATGNAATLGAAGLMVTIPEVTVPVYDIVKDADSGDYAAIYHLTKDGTNTGAAINIPKDLFVKSGEIVDNPAGQPAGKYIKLTLQNQDEPIYINVADLVDAYTAGNGITISATNVVSAKVVAANGLSVGTSGIAMGLASANANGAMSSDQFTKLAGIDEGATADTITLNGTATKIPSFYAPIAAGTNGQHLVSTGTGAPTWQDMPTISETTSTSLTGILKGNGTTIEVAAPGTDYMPPVAITTSDNGKFLRVVNGAWAAAEIQNANGEEF